MTFSIMIGVQPNSMKEETHAYMHPRIAVKNAEKITELSDLERDIILKHMWGSNHCTPPRYKESLYRKTWVDNIVR